MSMQPLFETARETAVISKILADLVRTVQLIECEIAAQEERASVSDRSDVKYPMLARTLIERRDNLMMTIDALEQRLAERAPHDKQRQLSANAKAVAEGFATGEKKRPAEAGRFNVVSEVRHRIAAAPCEHLPRRRACWRDRTISTQPFARRHSGHAG